MVQLRIQANFVRLKFSIKEPSLSDCLDRSCTQRNGLIIKGTLKLVSAAYKKDESASIFSVNEALL